MSKYIHITIDNKQFIKLMKKCMQINYNYINLIIKQQQLPVKNNYQLTGAVKLIPNLCYLVIVKKICKFAVIQKIYRNAKPYS